MSTEVVGVAGAEAVVFCPACGTRYVVDAEILTAGPPLVVLCTSCGKGSSLANEDQTRAARRVDALMAAVTESHWPRVVVGHEVPAAARSIADTLRRGGLSPVCVRSGDEVLAATDPTMPAPPAAVVIDVGIPGVMAFEIIESLRANPATAKVPVVLLASVYEKTRYKRRPNRLYGADAYLELHHVPDRLVDVVRGLVNSEAIGEERQQAPVDRARAAGLRIDGPDPSTEEGARVLARRLLADVVLYHGDEVALGVRRGTPFSGIVDGIDAARDFHARAGGSVDVFEDERRAFAARLADAKGLGGKPLG